MPVAVQISGKPLGLIFFAGDPEGMPDVLAGYTFCNRVK